MFGLFKRKPAPPPKPTCHFYEIEPADMGAGMMSGDPIAVDMSGHIVWVLLPIPCAVLDDGRTVYPLLAITPGVGTGSFLFEVPIAPDVFHVMRQRKDDQVYTSSSHGVPPGIRFLTAKMHAAANPAYVAKLAQEG
jgi:hypothetical protein